MGLVFPFTIAILDVGAAVVYMTHKQWAMGITWLCYAVAAVSLGIAGK